MKTITLSDFSQQDTEFLADLIDTYLQDQGIQASSFAFNIDVDSEGETGGNNLSLNLDDRFAVVA